MVQVYLQVGHLHSLDVATEGFLHYFWKGLFPGWTPLHVAAEGGREAVVEVLLRHNADSSLVTDTGLDDHDD